MGKTIEQLFNEAAASKDMLAELLEAEKKGSLSDFAGKYDCEASDEEIREYITAKVPALNSLSLDDIEGIVGGKPSEKSVTVWKCNNCGHESNSYLIYSPDDTLTCPNCGAPMSVVG